MSPTGNIGGGCAAALSNNGDVTRRAKSGMCLSKFKEENIRFILLAFFLILYLVFGAFFFSYFEEETETNIRKKFVTIYDEFVSNLSSLSGNVPPVYDNNKYIDSSLENNSEYLLRPSITLDTVHELLYAYGNATKAGVIFQRRRWDFVGSFYFTWTIVSTIGYGATTPMTTLGKMLVIPYGFLGCAGGLLFFNLFLERIITFLASCMRMYRIQRQKRRPSVYGGNNIEMWSAGARRGSPGHSSAGNGSTVEEPNWKPSVYWVMLCLFIMSAIVIFISAAMFQHMEGWTFLESVYFSFVSYATIGFGDYVSLQERDYGSFEMIYRVGAFTIMVFGCCCIYSLLNVTSIVIKQSLNWLIKSIDYCEYCCCCCNRCSSAVRRKFSTKRRRGGRRGWSSNSMRNIRSNFHLAMLARVQDTNSSNSHNQQNIQSHQANSPTSSRHCGPPGFDYDERRFSGDNMISLRGELNNKVSLAVMQKRLYETAQMSRSSLVYDSVSFSATSVGPLAIVTEKLGDSNHS